MREKGLDEEVVRIVQLYKELQQCVCVSGIMSEENFMDNGKDVKSSATKVSFWIGSTDR